VNKEIKVGAEFCIGEPIELSGYLGSAGLEIGAVA
jgi:hypothetical protein